MTDRISESEWLEFKALQDKLNPELPECPFCGIRHMPSVYHPYCDMVVRAAIFWATERRRRGRSAEDDQLARRYAGPPSSRDPR